LALSRNAPPSPMVGKAGLAWELGAVKEAWERDGHFALLHDLTNSVRIGDITVFGSSGPSIAEVKQSAGGGSRHREQVRRAQRALAKAGLDRVEHHLRGVRADSIGKDSNLAPFTIYPFDAELVAALTTDLLSFEYIVGWDRLARAFESLDFDVEPLLENASGP